MNFESLILEEERKDLLLQMAEKIKSTPRENRGPMIEANSMDGNCLVMPNGSNLKGFASEDPDNLLNAGLLNLNYGSRGSRLFTITPTGYRCYEWLMKQQGKAVERVETFIRRYLDMDDFKNIYKEAYAKLKYVEEKLWSSDSQQHYTTIGHLCREAHAGIC